MLQFLLLTTNRFGVLSRITSIVSASGTNIETVSVYPVGGSGLSMIHLGVSAPDPLAHRLHRKLSRLVDVIEVSMEKQGGAMSMTHSLPSTAV